MFCRFLINPAKDKDMRKWAVEGLSYLTLDAEIKEKLIEDRVALQALIDVAKVINDIILRILKSRIYFKFFSYWWFTFDESSHNIGSRFLKMCFFEQTDKLQLLIL